MRADPIESIAVAVPNRLPFELGVENTWAADGRTQIAVKQNEATQNMQSRRSMSRLSTFLKVLLGEGHHRPGL
jgi:hypothetical protein